MIKYKTKLCQDIQRQYLEGIVQRYVNQINSIFVKRFGSSLPEKEKESISYHYHTMMVRNRIIDPECFVHWLLWAKKPKYLGLPQDFPHCQNT